MPGLSRRISGILIELHELPKIVLARKMVYISSLEVFWELEERRLWCWSLKLNLKWLFREKDKHESLHRPRNFFWLPEELNDK